MIPIKWALIASVTAEELMPEVEKFAAWFLPMVTGRGKEINAYTEFDTQPSTTIFCNVGDAAGVRDAYEKIHNEFPSVSMVLHILPQQNSDEYGWMRSMCAQYSLIRQGILLDNALNRFQDTDLEVVLTNVAQWIHKRAGAIACGKAPGDRSFDLRVGATELLPTTNTRVHGNTDPIIKATTAVLHSEVPSTTSSVSLSSTVSVSGLPVGISDYSVAAIFENLRVAQVLVDEQTAKVTFANKFHAFNAVKKYNGHAYDRYRQLKVTPLGEDVAQQLQTLAA